MLRILLITLVVCVAGGCAPTIQLVGYGNRPQAQHGLKVELSHREDDAVLRVTNVSDDIISINQSPQAMEVHVLKDGSPVKPYTAICYDWISAPQPDDFVILSPGQTRDVIVPISAKHGGYTAIHWSYKLEKGVLYSVDLQLNPYFGRLTKETAGQVLGQFNIPNYLCEPIRTNTMILRAR